MIDLDAVTSLADLFRIQARSHPDAVAMIFADAQKRATTYGELGERACRVANGLIAEGTRPQSRVGYLGKNSDRFFEALGGSAIANTVLVGVNWRLAPPEIQYVLDHGETEILFVGAEFYSVIERIKAELPRLRRIIAVDGGHPDWPGFEEWRDGFPDADPQVPTAEDDTILQMYTSGTTGLPKGVELTSANYKEALRQGRDAGFADWTQEDRVSVFMPCFHVAGTNLGLLAFANGAQALITKEVNPEQILDLMDDPGFSQALFVPAVILFLLQQPRVRQVDFSPLKQVWYGASPITEELLRQARDVFGCEFVQGYGLTETSGTGVLLSAEDHRQGGNKLRSCGRPNPGVDLRIVNAAGQDVAPGEVGEIVMRGAHIMKSYWRNPAATAEAVVDGWFHTGDAGYRDEEGYVYIHDRVKDMIISGGENIYPAEVENALFGHPAIADVGVVGVPDEKWGEAVKAFVVLKPGQKAMPDEIIAHARERIARYKVPRSIEFIDALPRNPSGKIVRRELRKPYWEGRDREVG